MGTRREGKGARRAHRVGETGETRMKGPEDIARRLARWDESEGALGRHSLMLASLVVLLVALPLGNVLTGGGTSFSILLALVVVAAVFVSTPRRWSFVTALLIALASIIGLAGSEISGSDSLRVFADVTGLGLLGFTTLLMLNSLIYARRVSADTIVGGICVYLLIGLCFAMMFGLISDLDPGSIREGGQTIMRSVDGEKHPATRLLYFSFVTLTTLGYGDIRPHGEIAQMMAVAEAVIGQLYLAIFVARLVALYVATNRGR
jgi:hypothetical protein